MSIPFTSYQSKVEKIVRKMIPLKDYILLPCFRISVVTNMIAKGWKTNIPFAVTAEDVLAYIKTLQK